MDEVIAERDRIVSEYTELIGSDEDRATFEGKLGLARTVFPYVENHNFYVEHWGHSVVWRKMRDLGGIFVKEGFFARRGRHLPARAGTRCPRRCSTSTTAGRSACRPRGPKYWPREIERRRAGSWTRCAQWSPPPALGVPPEVITEPFTVMLWGITSDSVQQWLGGAEADGGLSGFAASPGIAEGPARVIMSADGIGELQEGEILVAPLTAPSWAPVFGKIAATVTDVGGIMSHAAIVCREYGLPAVTGHRVRHQDHQDRPAPAGRRQHRARSRSSTDSHGGAPARSDRRTGRRRTRITGTRGRVTMLTAEQNDELTQVAAGHADGRAAAPVLVPGGVHPRA